MGEDEDKASGFDCILEKVDSSPEKIEPTISELAGQGQIIAVQGSVEERHSAMPSVTRSFEEEFSKFTKKKVVQAESEVDSDSGQKELEGNFSADDENDEESGAENGLVVNSPAWSSLSLILEPQQQEQSPSKTKVKRKTRKSLSRTTPLKERNGIVPNKTVPTLEHSGTKRYRRSSKMSSLIAEATDTDDQSPVRPAARISQLLRAKEHLEAKPDQKIRNNEDK